MHLLKCEVETLGRQATACFFFIVKNDIKIFVLSVSESKISFSFVGTVRPRQPKLVMITKSTSVYCQKAWFTEAFPSGGRGTACGGWGVRNINKLFHINTPFYTLLIRQPALRKLRSPPSLTREGLIERSIDEQPRTYVHPRLNFPLSIFNSQLFAPAITQTINKSITYSNSIIIRGCWNCG